MPLDALLAKYSIERQIKVWRAIARATGQYLTPEDIIRMENEVILVMGKAET